VRLQASVTHALRHEGNTLVQVASSKLSTSTMVQREGARTASCDLFGRPVTLETRWEEGGVWVVDVRGSCALAQLRRWLESDDIMVFEVITTPLRRFARGGAAGGAGASAPRVTLRRRLHRVSVTPDGAPPAEEAERAAARLAWRWRLIFGSWKPPADDPDDDDGTSPRCC
jgi:hypothetical protein